LTESYYINPATGYRAIRRQNNNSPDYVRQRMASPEMTAKRLAARKAWMAIPGNRVGRKPGQPNGVRWKDFLVIKAAAEARAEKVMKIMNEKKIWVADNDVAEKAMRTAVEILSQEVGHTRDRLTAAKTILEFTQTKPVVKNETTLKSAEDFLAALMKDEE
jgi:hypothetical protein